MSDTGIQWTQKTWSPVTGCTRVSSGCDNCYAFSLHDRRHLAWKRDRWKTAPPQYHAPFSRVQLLERHLEEPLHWREPQKVFVTSMGDVFHDDVPDDYLRAIWTVMARCSQHTFQVLTKRPARMQRFLDAETTPLAIDVELEKTAKPGDCLVELDEWPLRNVWCGVSVEDQAAAEARIPLLLETPAAIRFLSCEPLLEAVYLPDAIPCGHYCAEDVGHVDHCLTGIDWIIVGGESGPLARRCREVYVESLIAQGRKAGAAVFVKQLGAVWAEENQAHHSHGGDPAEWPAHLRVREFPEAVTA